MPGEATGESTLIHVSQCGARVRPGSVARPELFKLLFEVSLPTVRQSINLQGSVQCSHIVLAVEEQSSDLGNGDLMSIAAYELNGIARSDFALFEHGEVETSSPSFKKSFDNVVPPKLHRQLV